MFDEVQKFNSLFEIKKLFKKKENKWKYSFAFNLISDANIYYISYCSVQHNT